MGKVGNTADSSILKYVIFLSCSGILVTEDMVGPHLHATAGGLISLLRQLVKIAQNTEIAETYNLQNQQRNKGQ